MNQLFRKIELYKKIIDILIENSDQDGISNIYQSEIGKLTNRSQTCISKTLRRLEKVDKCIEKIDSGKYKVNKKNILENGPISKILKFYVEVAKEPELLDYSYQKQAELLGMTVYEIEMVWGYLHGTFGGPTSSK